MGAIKLEKRTGRSLPTAEYVEVTPDMASEWLGDAGRNRNLNGRRVESYTATMKRGDWMVNNDAVTFDEFGKLTNGQHRLTAVAASGVTITMLVVRAVPGRAQLVMDQGLKRTPHDQIALREGWDVKPIHTAIAKSMVTSVGGIGHRQRQAFITDIQLLDRYYSKHHRAIEFVVSVMWGRTNKGITIAPVMAPVARAFYTQDRDKLIRFGEVVVSGMADRPGDAPAVVLRNYLLAGREKSLSARVGGDRFLIYKKTEIALSAYLQGRSIERLGQRNIEDELFPIPNDVVIKLPKGADADEDGKE